MGDKFKEGDRVRLRSGGPWMTVIRYGSFNMGAKNGYECTWFDSKGELKSSVFAEGLLDMYPEGASAMKHAESPRPTGRNSWLAR